MRPRSRTRRRSRRASRSGSSPGRPRRSGCRRSRRCRTSSGCPTGPGRSAPGARNNSGPGCGTPRKARAGDVAGACRRLAPASGARLGPFLPALGEFEGFEEEGVGLDGIAGSRARTPARSSRRLIVKSSSLPPGGDERTAFIAIVVLVLEERRAFVFSTPRISSWPTTIRRRSSNSTTTFRARTSRARTRPVPRAVTTRSRRPAIAARELDRCRTRSAGST